MKDIVKSIRSYWISVNADGTIAQQNGIGLLTVGLAVSVYTITMPANFTVPLNRRGIIITPFSATLGDNAVYDQAASANNTVVIRGHNQAGAAANVGFLLEIHRMIDEVGAGAG